MQVKPAPLARRGVPSARIGRGCGNLLVLMELLRFSICFGLLLVPGLLLHRALTPRPWSAEDWIEGTGLGLGLLTLVGFWASFLSVELIPIAVAALGVAAGLLAIRRAHPAAATPLDHPAAWLAVLLVLVAVSRYAVAVQTTLPPGWDPTFHLLLASRIQESGQIIHDWRPFADAALNYPTASHTLLAVLSNTSQLDLHVVFRLIVPALGVLTTAAMYLFATRATGSPPIGLASAVAYGLWAWWGSIDYYRWGGLPNELGMLLFMASMAAR